MHGNQNCNSQMQMILKGPLRLSSGLRSIIRLENKTKPLKVDQM